MSQRQKTTYKKTPEFQITLQELEGILTRLEAKALIDSSFDYRIWDEGAEHIAQMEGITHLNAINNKIGDEGAKQIAKMKGITHLYLTHNSISSGEVAKITRTAKETGIALIFI